MSYLLVGDSKAQGVTLDDEPDSHQMENKESGASTEDSSRVFPEEVSALSVSPTPSTSTMVSPKQLLQKQPIDLSADSRGQAVIKKVIIKDKFPEMKLNVNEVTLIQKKILQLADLMHVSEELPKIQGLTLLSGALIIACNDDKTGEWLTNTFHMNHNILQDSILLVVNSNELLKPIVVSFKTQDIVTKQPENLLRRISQFNPDLKTNDWKFLYNQIEPLLTSWYFEVDWESAVAIQKADLRAFTGLDQGTFKILHDSNESEKGIKDSMIEVKPTNNTDSGDHADLPAVSQFQEYKPLNAAGSQFTAALFCIPPQAHCHGISVPMLAAALKYATAPRPPQPLPAHLHHPDRAVFFNPVAPNEENQFAVQLEPEEVEVLTASTNIELGALRRHKSTFSSILHQSLIRKVTLTQIHALSFAHTNAKKLLAAGSKCGEIGFWIIGDQSRKEQIVRSNPHTSRVSCLEFDAEGNTLETYSCSYDGTFQWGNLQTRTFKKLYQPPKNDNSDHSCSSFDFISPFTYLLSQCHGDAIVIDKRTETKHGEQHYSLNTVGNLKTVHFHPDKNHFISLSSKGVCSLWDLRKMNQAPVCQMIHSERTNSAYFSPFYGKYILTTSEDKMYIFDSSELTESIRLLKVIEHDNHTKGRLVPFRATWLPKNDTFVVGSKLHQVCLEAFGVSGRYAHRFCRTDCKSICPIVACHPFEPIVAGGDSSGKVYVFDENACF